MACAKDLSRSFLDKMHLESLQTTPHYWTGQRVKLGRKKYVVIGFDYRMNLYRVELLRRRSRVPVRRLMTRFGELFQRYIHRTAKWIIQQIHDGYHEVMMKTARRPTTIRMSHNDLGKLRATRDFLNQRMCQPSDYDGPPTWEGLQIIPWPDYKNPNKAIEVL